MASAWCTPNLIEEDDQGVALEAQLRHETYLKDLDLLGMTLDEAQGSIEDTWLAVEIRSDGTRSDIVKVQGVEVSAAHSTSSKPHHASNQSCSTTGLFSNAHSATSSPEVSLTTAASLDDVSDAAIITDDNNIDILHTGGHSAVDDAAIGEESKMAGDAPNDPELVEHKHIESGRKVAEASAGSTSVATLHQEGKSGYLPDNSEVGLSGTMKDSIPVADKVERAKIIKDIHHELEETTKIVETEKQAPEKTPLKVLQN